MDFWIKQEQCTGCAACANACPKDAIQLCWNDDGYPCPIIDDTLCVNCSLCERVCPVLKRETNASLVADPKQSEPIIYAAWSRTHATRYNSTSGGVFSELAKAALKEGAYISGAVYDENQMVHHEISDTEDGLERIRQSKYTQSETGLVFREIRNLLCGNKKVVYCGTPCQVAGLYEFLGQDYDNLTTIDFICRGINSPLAYRAYLDELEELYGAKVTKVWFKNKEHGWNNFSTRIDFANGKYYLKTRHEDLYTQAYIHYNLFIRPSCTQCYFKGIPRVADITLADFWKIDKELDEDLGTSMVLINSEKGDLLFRKSRCNLMVFERNYEEASKGNICLTQSVQHGIHSTEFMNLLKNGMRFSSAFYSATKQLPKVSVIIPVEQITENFKLTINSILNQNCKNLEILMICASPDEEIRNAVSVFCKKNPEITLLPPAVDMSAALNDAVLASSGEYLHFCTGNELFYEGLYESIIGDMLQAHADVACFGWHDFRKHPMAQNAFNGTGNMQALLELCLTDADESTDYSGYGIHLKNKIFRKDALFLDGQFLEFKENGYAMTEFFWLVRAAFCCNKALFTSKTMMQHTLPDPVWAAPRSMVLKSFCSQVEETLRCLEGVQPHAYSKTKNLLYKYEIALIDSLRSVNGIRQANALQTHAAEILTPDLDENNILDLNLDLLNTRQRLNKNNNTITSLKKDRTFLQNKAKQAEKERIALQNKVTQAEKDRTFLKNKVKQVEKDRTFLQNKASKLEKDYATLQSNANQVEKDRMVLQSKANQLEKDCAILQSKISQSEKDCAILQNKINQAEKDCAALQNKVLQVEKDRTFLKNKVQRVESELGRYTGSILARSALRLHNLFRRVCRKLHIKRYCKSNDTNLQ